MKAIQNKIAIFLDLLAHIPAKGVWDTISTIKANLEFNHLSNKNTTSITLSHQCYRPQKRLEDRIQNLRVFKWNVID